MLCRQADKTLNKWSAGNDCYILASEDDKGKSKMQKSTVLKYLYSKRTQVPVWWKELEMFMFADVPNIPCKDIKCLTGMDPEASLETCLGLWSETICKVGF